MVTRGVKRRIRRASEAVVVGSVLIGLTSAGLGIVGALLGEVFVALRILAGSDGGE